LYFTVDISSGNVPTRALIELPAASRETLLFASTAGEREMAPKT